MSSLVETILRCRARLEEIVGAPLDQPAPYLVDVEVLQREQRARALECGRELGRAVRDLEEQFGPEWAAMVADSIKGWGHVLAEQCPAAADELRSWPIMEEDQP